MADRNPSPIIGGRAEALLRLAQLAQSVGISIPAFDIVPAVTLAEWDRSERLGRVTLPNDAEWFPATILHRWNRVDDSVRNVFEQLLEVLGGGGRPPVIKCSYLADNRPEHLSFAGIGATSVPPAGGGLGSLCAAAGKVLQARYSGLPVYYRIAHPSRTNLDVGLVAMKYLPGQTVWGTIWGGPAGFVCQCVKEDVVPKIYYNVAALIGTAQGAAWPSWLRGRGFSELIAVVEFWCASGVAGKHFDIEFCLSDKGALHLTQWRLIPERSATMLDVTLLQGAERLPPSPFSESRIPMGLRIRGTSLPSDVRQLSKSMKKSRDEVWVIPYRSSNADLFKVLLAGHLQPGKRLPPLVVEHRAEIAVGHLHALAVEDPNLTTIFHRVAGANDCSVKRSLRTGAIVSVQTKAGDRRTGRPRMLRAGDLIGIFSPSAPVYLNLDKRWDRSIAAFKEAFAVTLVEAPHAKNRFGFLSARSHERARDFMEMMLDPKIAGIITSYGGHNCNGLFEHIDFDALRGVEKVLIGYSDTSALLLALHAQTGLVTFHGPALLPQFGDVPEPFNYSVQMLRAAVFNDGPMGFLRPPEMYTAQYNPWSEKPQARLTTRADPWETWRPGEAEGRILVGNIETINFLVGTPYFPETKGAILFLEATGAEARLPRVERSLTHLRSAGHLDQIAGLVFARCPDATPENGRTLKDVVIDLVCDFDIPVVGGVDFGHTDPILTLPNGCLGHLRAVRDNVHIAILDPAVQAHGSHR